jgi:glycosyltransferase involved in cell wall biosynthesis
VITADTEAARELLVDGESALLVPPDDPPALAAAIARLAADDELRLQIAAAGNRVFRERASRRALGARWAELLSTLLG